MTTTLLMSLDDAIMIWFSIYTTEIKLHIRKMLLPLWNDALNQHPCMEKIQAVEGGVKRKRALPILLTTELMRRWIVELDVEQKLQTVIPDIMKAWRDKLIKDMDGEVVELNGKLEFIEDNHRHYTELDEFLGNYSD